MEKVSAIIVAFCFYFYCLQTPSFPFYNEETEAPIIEGFVQGYFCGMNKTEMNPEKFWICINAFGREYTLVTTSKNQVFTELSRLTQGSEFVVKFKVVMEFMEEANGLTPIAVPLSISKINR